jgi:hypothetical protein
MSKAKREFGYDPEDVPGDAVQSAMARDESARKVGYAIMLYDHVCSAYWRGSYEITGLSLRAPQTEGGEFLVVVRGFDHEGAPVVGFHSALSAGEALAGAARRLADGTIKFKPDAYRS